MPRRPSSEEKRDFTAAPGRRGRAPPLFARVRAFAAARRRKEPTPAAVAAEPGQSKWPGPARERFPRMTCRGRPVIGHCSMGDAGLQATLRRVFGNRRSSAGESFLAVDGLRGLAVLLVLLGHIYRGGVAVFPKLTMVAAGASGVELFFV